MAAYWLLTFDIAPESNDHSPPTDLRVSTKPWSAISRGGISGKKAKPMRAKPVVMARVLRQSGYRVLSRRNNQMRAITLTMKWALP